MKRLVFGILAHVDAGKTTLSESILYTCGRLKTPGRVDKKDAFLDNYTLERERGITIFSKQAVFEYENTSFTLLDTPGHVDFSAETERTLSVLDAAVLVISGPEGVQAHTRTLWRLLKNYDIPVFIFVNKTDRNVNKTLALENIRRELSGVCVEMSGIDDSRRNRVLEEIAMCREDVMEEFLSSSDISDESIIDLVGTRSLFPVCFGSALKNEGVDTLLKLVARYCPEPYPEEEFGARVFKIGRDNEGNRLTYLKVTGGSIASREAVSYRPRASEEIQVPDKDEAGEIRDKINQIRVYSGPKYTVTDKAVQGMVVAVTGLSATYPGQNLGIGEGGAEAELIPVMTYRVVEKDAGRLRTILGKLRILEEEEPTLHVYWDEALKELCIRIMGEIQLEIIKYQLKERFGEDLVFDKGSVLYKETVTAPVIGVGHFEPLRHYAEVHLLIEPAPRGTGISTASLCSTNDLEINWQRLINTHIYEREHKGVLIGEGLTDVKITIVAGRAHLKHTEGGDFRQATYRAVRQGLMQAQSVILEPYYEFILTVPKECVGRAMSDIDRMSGRLNGDIDIDEGSMSVLKGYAPVSEMQGYVKDVSAYTKGLGTLTLTHGGYRPCHNQDEVIAARGYDPEADLRNPSSSVFCAHGAGFVVPWNEVDRYKHINCELRKTGDETRIIRKEGAQDPEYTADNAASRSEERWMGVDEVDAIIERTAYSNRNNTIKNPYRKHRGEKKESRPASANRSDKAKAYPEKEKYLLVDGYNIIHAWKELNELSKASFDGARERLNEILSNYQASRGMNLIVVYDAYRVSGHPAEYYRYHNIMVVYTKEAETADKFIERFAHVNASMYDVTVATSDGLEQIIIRGAGCRLMTATDLYEDVERDNARLREQYMSAPFASAGMLIKDVLDKKKES